MDCLDQNINFSEWITIDTHKYNPHHHGFHGRHFFEWRPSPWPLHCGPDSSASGSAPGFYVSSPEYTNRQWIICSCLMAKAQNNSRVIGLSWSEQTTGWWCSLHWFSLHTVQRKLKASRRLRQNLFVWIIIVKVLGLSICGWFLHFLPEMVNTCCFETLWHVPECISFGLLRSAFSLLVAFQFGISGHHFSSPFW